MTQSGPSPFLKAAQAEPYVAPTATPPGNLFFHYTKPDGDTFLSSAAQVEGYLRQGFKVVGEETISDTDSFRDVVSPGSNEPPAAGVVESTAAAPQSEPTTAP